MWIVWVTMSEYEYWAMPASITPVPWFCPYTYCWMAPPDPPMPTVYRGTPWPSMNRSLTMRAFSPPRIRL
jgi:hypothetical protein